VLVISGVSYTPKAILIIRDLIREKMRFRSTLQERQIVASSHSLRSRIKPYKFSSGDGQSEIKAASSATGIVNFSSGLSDENLWFVKVGNNLQVDILGSNDKLTIDDWFGGSPTASVQGFTASGLKLDSQVAQLVSAMATYATNNAGFNPATATQMPGV
jgi:hypothetical protein